MGKNMAFVRLGSFCPFLPLAWQLLDKYQNRMIKWRLNLRCAACISCAYWVMGKNLPYFFDISMGKCPLRFGISWRYCHYKTHPETEIPGPKLRATDRCTVGGDGSILADFVLGGPMDPRDGHQTERNCVSWPKKWFDLIPIDWLIWKKEFNYNECCTDQMHVFCFLSVFSLTLTTFHVFCCEKLYLIGNLVLYMAMTPNGQKTGSGAQHQVQDRGSTARSNLNQKKSEKSAGGKVTWITPKLVITGYYFISSICCHYSWKTTPPEV